MGRTQIRGKQVFDDSLTGADFDVAWGIWDETETYGPTGTINDIRTVLYKGILYKLRTSVTTNTTAGQTPDISADWTTLNTETITAASATINDNTDRIFADVTSNAITLTLPLAANVLNGKQIFIKHIAGDVTANNITVNADTGDNIDGNSNFIIDSEDYTLILEKTASNTWRRYSSNIDVSSSTESDRIDIYNSADGSFTTATTINLNTVRLNSAPSLFSVASGEVTINSNINLGIYFRASADTLSNSRTESRAWLEIDSGSGFAEVDGTSIWLYHRQISQGKNTGSGYIAYNASSGDKVRLRIERSSGSGNLEYVAEGCSLLIHNFKGGAIGPEGPPGASDHGALTGLGDDDHLQYLTEARHDALPNDNPHGVTASQVGLGNVDNTSDLNKPVSTAQQAALDLKADISSLSAVATSGNHSDLTLDDGTNPHGTTKSDVGLGNVDNTSDADKPVSTAQQAALDLKTDLTTFNTHASRHLPSGADPLAIGTPTTIGTANTVGTSNDFSRGNHSHDHGNQTNPAHHAIATQFANGFMSSTDKVKLDLLELRSSIRTVTGSTSAVLSDYIIQVNNSSPVTISLPAISSLFVGKDFLIKDINNSKLNPITIQASFINTIDGNSSVTLSSTKGFIVLTATSTTTWIVSSQNALEQDIQTVFATPNTTTTSTSYVDLPAATLTTAGNKTKDYLITMSGGMTHSSNGDRLTDFILNINGVDNSQSLKTVFTTDADAVRPIDRTISLNNIAPGTIIKIRWKTSNNTATAINTNLTIRGLG